MAADIFFLDCEYTNGNLYVGEIFEIALLCKSTGNIFHSYVRIQTVIPKYVREMCNISDKQLNEIYQSPTFSEIMDDLLIFVKEESRSLNIYIIAHGGFNSDIPLIINNCKRSKYSCNGLANYMFVDSMLYFKNKGILKPGLDNLNVTEMRRYHTAINDVKILSDITDKLIGNNDMYLLLKDAVNFDYFLQYLKAKMPISIAEMYV